MKAIRVSQFGDASVLKLQEVEKPKPVGGQALVKIEAAGLNFIDIYHRRGTYPMPLSLPYTPGLEASGVVESVADGVTTVRPGDRVAYTNTFGSYAEWNVVDADTLIPLPEEISFLQGAAIPLQGMTAHYLIHEFHKPEVGETVLVHAAAGGMGLLLVQWLKHLDIRVIGTVSSEEKAEAAKKAGADHVILYTKEDFVTESKRLTEGRGVDLIIDGVGKTTFPGNLNAVKVRGHIVIFGSASGPADPIGPNSLQGKSITVSGGHLFNFTQSRGEILERAGAVIEGVKEGWLNLAIDKTFPLDDAESAHRRLEERKSSGKILLNVRGGR